MASEFKLFWTDEAIHNLEQILDYLKTRWTQREVERFKIQLSRQLNLILQNPKLFSISQHNLRLRKAVLSKQTTIFHELSGNTINLIYLFNTKQDLSKIK